MPELRIQLSEDQFHEVQRAAAVKHVDPADYVARMVADDLLHTRFAAGAADFIAQHGAGFGEHFGTSTAAGRTAA